MSSCLASKRQRANLCGIVCCGRNKESFRVLVQKHAFHRIVYRLKDHESFAENVEWLYEDMKQQTPLHFILSHRPPVELVNLILQYSTKAGKCHVPEEALDVEGRTPLHIAAAHNCSFDVLERLLSGVSLVVPALTKDNMGRCPLHWACCYPSLPGRAESDNKFDSILLLLDAYPQAVNVPDIDGKTPLDYALYRVLDQRVVDVLERCFNSQKEQMQQGGANPRKKKKSSKILGTPPRRPLGELNNDGAVATNDSSSVDSSSVPSQVPGSAAIPGVSRFFLSRLLFRNDTGGNEDDVSSIGWNSSVALSSSMDSSRSPAATPTRGRHLSPLGLGPPSPVRNRMLPSSLLESTHASTGPQSETTGDQLLPPPRHKQGSDEAKNTAIRTKSLFSGRIGRSRSSASRKFTDPVENESSRTPLVDEM